MDLRYWNSATPLEKDFCIFRNGSSPLAQQGVFTSIDFTDVSASSIDLHVVGASGLSDVAGVTGDSSHQPHSSLPRRVASVFAGVAGTLDPVSDCALAAFFRLFWLSDRISGSASSASSSLRRRKEAVCFGL